MDAESDRSLSLQELEQDDWGQPNFSSYLLTNAHRLRRKPLNTFTVGDLRLMNGQNIGLPFLIPMALEHPEREPLVEGDYYPGDLILAVLGTDPYFWPAHEDWRARVGRVVLRARAELAAEVEPDDHVLRYLHGSAARGFAEAAQTPPEQD